MGEPTPKEMVVVRGQEEMANRRMSECRKQVMAGAYTRKDNGHSTSCRDLRCPQYYHRKRLLERWSPGPDLKGLPGQGTQGFLRTLIFENRFQDGGFFEVQKHGICTYYWGFHSPKARMKLRRELHPLPGRM